MKLYDQAKAFGKPLTGEMAAIRQKQQNIDDYTATTNDQNEDDAPQPAKPLVRPDLINPKAQYGDRGKEKRIDVRGMTGLSGMKPK